MEKEQVIRIPLADIIPNRFQPREIFNEQALKELAVSIQEHGVIQPIIVRPLGSKYEIIAGERRYKASNMAGITDIPAIVRQLDDKEASKVALLENLQRKNLTAIEEALTYQTILKLDDMNQADLARTMGKSQASVSNKLRLLKLPEEVQNALMEEKISERHARALLRVPSKTEQINLLKRTIEERIPVRKLDNIIKEKKEEKEEEKMNQNTNPVTPTNAVGLTNTIPGSNAMPLNQPVSQAASVENTTQDLASSTNQFLQIAAQEQQKAAQPAGANAQAPAAPVQQMPNPFQPDLNVEKSITKSPFETQTQTDMSGANGLNSIMNSGQPQQGAIHTNPFLQIAAQEQQASSQITSNPFLQNAQVQGQVPVQNNVAPTPMPEPQFQPAQQFPAAATTNQFLQIAAQEQKKAAQPAAPIPSIAKPQMAKPAISTNIETPDESVKQIIKSNDFRYAILAINNIAQDLASKGIMVEQQKKTFSDHLEITLTFKK